MNKSQKCFWYWTLYQFHPRNIYKSVFEEDFQILYFAVEVIMTMVGIIFIVSMMVAIGIPLAFYRAVFNAPRRLVACKKEMEEK